MPPWDTIKGQQGRLSRPDAIDIHLGDQNLSHHMRDVIQAKGQRARRYPVSRLDGDLGDRSVKGCDDALQQQSGLSGSHSGFGSADLFCSRATLPARCFALRIGQLRFQDGDLTRGGATLNPIPTPLRLRQAGFGKRQVSFRQDDIIWIRRLLQVSVLLVCPVIGFLVLNALHLQAFQDSLVERPAFPKHVRVRCPARLLLKMRNIRQRLLQHLFGLQPVGIGLLQGELRNRVRKDVERPLGFFNGFLRLGDGGQGGCLIEVSTLTLFKVALRLLYRALRLRQACPGLA